MPRRAVDFESTVYAIPPRGPYLTPISCVYRWSCCAAITHRLMRPACGRFFSTRRALRNLWSIHTGAIRALPSSCRCGAYLHTILQYSGWGGRNRTFIHGFKARCPAVERPPNIFVRPNVSIIHHQDPFLMKFLRCRQRVIVKFGSALLAASASWASEYAD